MTDTPTQPGSVPVIGVGASAGGLEAFQLLIGGLPEDKTFAVVLVQHLDPDHDSLMPELIGSKTTAPVHSVTDGMQIEAGHIYLIPPGFEMEMQGSLLRLKPFASPRGLRRPIDRFFHSLAATHEHRAIAVVLSGTGSDGAEGARAIKAGGGLVFVQDTRQAKYDGMPHAVIEQGSADIVLRAEEIGDVAREYISVRSGIEPVLENDAEFLDRILRQVRFRTGHDFSDYKQATMLRRIAVRMSVLSLTSPAAYLQYLVENKAEAGLLFRDLLINVTSFFRDRDHHDLLARDIIPDLVAKTPELGEIRLWSVGCSTGEEAYTLAILLSEELSRTNRDCRIVIFATDIDEQALEIARRGFYSNAIAEALPAELLERYFRPTPKGYEVVPRLREMVRFSRHSFIKDPPFSKLHMVVCRNVLIYLRDRSQDLAMRVFHYALSEGGVLFLGPSENPHKVAEYFDEVSPRARLFRRRPGPAHALQLDEASGAVAGKVARAMRDDQTQAMADLSRALLANHVSPYLHIDRAGQVLFSAAEAARYLAFRGGAMQTRLLALIAPELESTVRRVIELPATAGARSEREFQGLVQGSEVRIVIAAERLADGTLLLVFHDRLNLRADRPGTDGEADAAASAYINTLEQELDAVRDELRGTVEELETSNEELKSSNEEMMSMNEELQSANEELTTINDELQQKLRELNEANMDLSNFIRSARTATVFLDPDLGLRSFTPEAAQFFSFAEQDKGRRLSDLTSQIDQDRLLEMCRICRKTGEIQEATLETRDGATILNTRVMPYVPKEGATGEAVRGLVITLQDVTELTGALNDARQARAEAERRMAEVEQLYHGSPMAMGLIGRDCRFIRVNEQLAALHELPLDQLLAASVRDVMPSMADHAETMVARVFETGQPVRDEEISGATLASPDTPRLWRSDWVPFTTDGRIEAVSVTVRDVTAEHDTARHMHRLMQELEHRVKNMLANVVSLINRARRDATGDQEVYLTLTRRIEALAKTHAMLTAEEWSSAPLRQVIAAETTDIYDDSRVTLRGPDIHINSRATVSLGMAVHELATNAAKYGAFSVPDGHVTVDWARVTDGEGDRIVLTWQERGGPPTRAPDRMNFGSQLIRATIESNLEGNVCKTWEPEGMTCVMTMGYETICSTDGTGETTGLRY